MERERIWSLSHVQAKHELLKKTMRHFGARKEVRSNPRNDGNDGRERISYLDGMLYSYSVLNQNDAGTGSFGIVVLSSEGPVQEGSDDGCGRQEVRQDFEAADLKKQREGQKEVQGTRRKSKASPRASGLDESKEQELTMNA